MCLQIISSRTEAFFPQCRLTRVGFKHKQRWLWDQTCENLCKVKKSCKSSSSRGRAAGMHLNLSFTLQKNTATKV